MSAVSTPIGLPDTAAVEVGAVAVMDGVQRPLDVDVYSAESQVATRPTLSVAESAAVTDVMSQSLTFYQPQPSTVTRTMGEIEVIKQVLSKLRETSSSESEHLQQIADLEEMLRVRVTQCAIWEVQRTMQETRRETEIPVFHLIQTTQPNQLLTAQTGHVAISIKDRQIHEMHQAVSTEIQALEQSNATLSQQLNFALSAREQVQQQLPAEIHTNATRTNSVASLEDDRHINEPQQANMSETRVAEQPAVFRKQTPDFVVKSEYRTPGPLKSDQQHLCGRLTSLEGHVRTATLEAQKRFEGLTQQMAELSTAQVATIGNNSSGQQNQQERLAEKDAIVAALLVQLHEKEQQGRHQTAEFFEKLYRLRKRLNRQLRKHRKLMQEIQRRQSVLEELHTQQQREPQQPRPQAKHGTATHREYSTEAPSTSTRVCPRSQRASKHSALERIKNQLMDDDVGEDVSPRETPYRDWKSRFNLREVKVVLKRVDEQDLNRLTKGTLKDPPKQEESKESK